ncbi:MFS transporter [Paenibacillus thiaminolyticus]|uniref:MFS transporter n=1 Tax=Paenibacillus thiaminolyticus TaxID=49283 RepID=UPI002350F3C0|nr:MFS transporter [Paenibacillus thiaminolyticus]MDG0874427.1 MFS transporter [Paenibacillus thiaminolyticus]WCR27049.1 MFS transporter [Paenibacillus thiaminolyticus]
MVGNVGLGLTAGLMYAMLADTVDYGEWRSGVRAQGLLTASSSFGVKFGMGFGGALAAWVLAIGHYVPNQDQTASGLTAIQFSCVWIPFMCFMLSVGLLLFYRLEHVEQRMNQDLEAKRRQGGKAAIQA